MIHEHEARARRDCGDDRGDGLLWPGDGEGDARGDHFCTAAPRAFGGHVVARIVAVVGHEDFVAGLEFERTQHGVHRCRGIRDERKLLRIRADESCEFRTRGVEAIPDLAPQEAHGIPLHLSAQARLLVHHHAGTCTERAVIEKCEAVFEQPVFAERIHRETNRARAVCPRSSREVIEAARVS